MKAIFWLHATLACDRMSILQGQHFVGPWLSVRVLQPIMYCSSGSLDIRFALGAPSPQTRLSREHSQVVPDEIQRDQLLKKCRTCHQSGERYAPYRECFWSEQLARRCLPTLRNLATAAPRTPLVLRKLRNPT